MKEYYTDSIKLAEFIKKRRLDLKITQEELSEISKIDYKHIQNFESYRRKNDPKYSTLRKLADALEVDIIELIFAMNSQDYSIGAKDSISLLVSEKRKK